MEFGRLYIEVQYAHHNIAVERSVSFVIPNLLENCHIFKIGQREKTLSLICLLSRRIAMQI